MKRTLQIGSILLLVVGSSLGDGRQPAKDAPPPAKVARPAPPKGGTPKQQPIPKGAARIVNPGNVVTRLFRMTPEQREQALEKLPPQQQENFRKVLEWFDELPKEQQAIQIRRIERFDQFSPEKKAEVKQLVKAASQLPPPRQAAVRQALFRLQQMSDQERENTLRRPQFQARFSPEELRIVTGLADAWMGPMPAPP